jgi:hypothetical protein
VFVGGGYFHDKRLRGKISIPGSLKEESNREGNPPLSPATTFERDTKRQMRERPLGHSCLIKVILTTAMRYQNGLE